MFDDTRDWLDRAEAVADPNVEIFFATQHTVYVGDPNDLDQIGDPRFEVPVPPPAIGDGTTISLSTRAVFGREEALAAHYRAVVEQATTVRKSFDDIRTHFWMRLGIRWKDNDLSFPRYVTWKEMDNFLGWLLLAEDENDWWDADEEWELAAVRKGSRFYFRQDNGVGEPYVVVSMDREALLAKVRELRDRILAIIEVLTSLLGTDVWTSCRHDDVDFGTDDWRPGATKRKPAGFLSRLWKRR